MHPGQWRAWQSTRQITAIVAGSRAGKSIFGPHWLLREMIRRGPGDYLVAAPTLVLLKKAPIPYIEEYFGSILRLGRLNRSDWEFRLSPDGCRRLWGHVPRRQPIIRFGYAFKPDSLEAATYLAAWLDEVGMTGFRLDSWYAVQRRCMMHQGRILITTTPYGWGWLHDLIWKPWEEHRKRGLYHPRIEVVNFRTTWNPAFPREEYEEALRTQPLWRIEMMFHGRFTQPAGMIYDCFVDANPTQGGNVSPTFRIPEHWPRHVGLDFGAVNTAAVFVAEELDEHGEKTGRLYVYDEYHPGVKKSAAEHAREFRSRAPSLASVIGGAASENDFRHDFRAAGVPVYAPLIKDKRAGIQCVWTALHTRQLLILDVCVKLLDQLKSYSYETDEEGTVNEDVIENEHVFHLCDALRYLISEMRRPQQPMDVVAFRTSQHGPEPTVMSINKYPDWIRSFPQTGTYQATPKIDGEYLPGFGPDFREQHEACYASLYLVKLITGTLPPGEVVFPNDPRFPPTEEKSSADQAREAVEKKTLEWAKKNNGVRKAIEATLAAEEANRAAAQVKQPVPPHDAPAPPPPGAQQTQRQPEMAGHKGPAGRRGG